MSDHLTGFRARLESGPAAYAAWCGMREPHVLETILREGYDCAVLDWQHGFHDFQSIETGIIAANGLKKPAFVRIGVGDFAQGARFLDWGAAGIIAPMINSAADAKAFAGFMKYPPMGGRSWGPPRAAAAMGFSNAEQLAKGNGATLAIAMIETREAMAELEDILAEPGIDGVFVGPADLSIALTHGGTVDPLHADVDAALTLIARKARAVGKIASAFCPDGRRGAELALRGYQLLSLGTDGSMLRNAARAEIRIARGQAGQSGAGY
jgi:4-hydroxy-2-oxoheptanedioate aldolase